MPFSATLVADGSSDRALLPIIEFLLDKHCPLPYSAQQALLLPPASEGLAARIAAAVHGYPCDLLFIHRDAEKENLNFRHGEIRAAIGASGVTRPHVCAVPMRMTESWLLVDEDAIRAASGNPNGKTRLTMPALARIEHLPDPKRDLKDLLETASNLARRRRIDFNNARQRVSEVMNYKKLQELSSFVEFECQVAQYFEVV